MTTERHDVELRCECGALIGRVAAAYADTEAGRRFIASQQVFGPLCGRCLEATWTISTQP